MAFNILTNTYSKLSDSIRVQFIRQYGLIDTFDRQQLTMAKHLDLMISAEKSDQMEVLYSMSIILSDISRGVRDI